MDANPANTTGSAACRLTPNRAQADAFLTALDEEAEHFCFQTFDDFKERKDGSLARVLNGTLDEHWDTLVDLNQRGAGVFVTVNRTDGNGRKMSNMVSPRAIFQEADRPNTPPPPLDPHMEVESSPDKFHRYCFIDPATAPQFDTWREGMNRMVVDFGSDPNACDPARVLRLPGFYHQKDPSRPFMVRIHARTPIPPYSWQQITSVIEPLPKKRVERAAMQALQGRGIENPLQLKSALAAIEPDCEYMDWLKVGMALHHASDGSGEAFALWDEWSATGSSYRDGETEIKWDSFGGYKDTPVMLGTIFFMAREDGWDWETEKLSLIENARAELQRVLAAVVTDPKAHLAPTTTEALSIIKAYDPREYEAARIDIKLANSSVRVCALDSLVDRHAAGDDGGHEDSLAKRLTDLAARRCELWHDQDGNAYATFQRTDKDDAIHSEHWRIDSLGFREWLGWFAHTQLKAAPASEPIKACQNALSGIAKFDGVEHKPARRVAKDESGYWIDLGDDRWRAIHVTATGWQIVSSPPVRFLRNKAMRPLPIPVPGGSIDHLWRLCNIPEEDRVLVLAWILECYRSDTPYPVLELIGEQGSAKSTTQETLRIFVDPNKVMLRGRPKGVEDVYVAAGSNHLVSLENLSGISPELSDALCTIATGGGQAGRQFYTNGEEHIIEAHNPVVLNGIGAVITRADLLDRTIALCLPTIRERMTEDEHTLALTEAAPVIFGALLDLFARTLALLPSVSIPPAQRPRMADFAHLREAMNRAMGGKSGEFLDLYTNHRRDAIRRTVDSNPVSVACMEFVEKGKSYSGTVKGLLTELNAFSMSMERGDYWPKSPRGLGDSLRRIAPALRQLGIQVSVETKPRRDGVHCELRLASDGGGTTAPHSPRQSKTRSQPSPTFTVSPRSKASKP
ncbi:PriCT-2 domain-containing protein [Candidatus Accumulibacter vicinus]|uniref:Uncharacterized protein n=1 Tax=Candidatus Accumulibacter vicinus TaxID=2954382 RepID=A0A084Y3I4_9PROT|nr:PriCT-2 domain-containing protein [Candidatus Accumulibacter vicinus]KFB69278.1 MAG: hypothetical protein CAPSK01_001023 [Candidatus Accumulibacter vicinus]